MINQSSGDRKLLTSIVECLGYAIPDDRRMSLNSIVQK